MAVSAVRFMSGSNDHLSPQTALATPHYAPSSFKTRWYRRRRHLIRACIILSIAIASIALYRMRDGIKDWNLSRLEHNCVTYTSPSEQIVYSALAEDVRTLSASSEEYSLLNSTTPAIAFMPSQWISFRRAFFNSKQYNIGPGSTGGLNLSPTVMNPVIFLGERTTPRGERQLICVTFSGFGGNTPWDVPTQPTYPASQSAYEIIFAFSTWTVGSSRTPPVLAVIGEHNVFSYVPPRNLRFFAGQPDPKNLTRFTVRYDLNGQSGQLDGILEGAGAFYFKCTGPLKQTYLDPNEK